MLRAHLPGLSGETPAEPSGRPRPSPLLPSPELLRRAVWIDLFEPGSEEVQATERALGLSLPGRADIAEIEPSSRVYQNGDALVMNLQLLAGMDSGRPAVTHLSLILTPGQLVTIRNAELKAFAQLADYCAHHAPDGGAPLLLRLLGHFVDRSADILESMGGDIDRLSERTFGFDKEAQMRVSTTELQKILRGIGRVQFVLNKVYESLATQSRVVAFLAGRLAENDGQPHLFPPQAREALDSLQRDLKSLSDNCSFLIESGNFLLDAAVGRISIEQNAIMTIFSVVAVIFMPPTLIASFFGMNFRGMPGLEQPWGYPLAVVLMLLSAALPYLWFRRKGWL